MHNRHAWTEKTHEGLKREIRVVKNGGIWRFQAKTEEEERWTYYEDPLESDLRAFREILFRKYQRRRAAYEDVVWADRELSRYAGLKSANDE